MAKFFVGQMVRVNCPVSTNHGKETNITKINAKGFDDGKLFFGAEVNLKAQVGWIGLCVFEYHELEPILPEGQQPVEIAKLLTEIPELEQVLGVPA